MSHPSALQSFPPRPGDELAGKYRVERMLGEGGMGVVVAATDLELGRPVAVKFLQPQFATDAHVVTRFMREARATVQIQSEHVVRVIEVGHLPDRTPFIVMEFLEGEDLSELLRGGSVPAATALEYVLQACEAIAEAHAKGIVHRDLKPANLFLTARADGSPTIKVLDFGISKVRDQVSPENATQAGTSMGSPMYMSPEHATSAQAVDARSDIWSIGVILYELLSGRCPHDGDTLPAILKAVMFDPAPPLGLLCPTLPPELCQVVHRCLEKDPFARYQDVGELAVALAPFGSATDQVSVQRIVRVVGRGPESAAPLPAPHFSAAPMGAVSRVRSRRDGTRGRWIAATVLVFALAGVGFALLSSRREAVPEPPPPVVASPASASPEPTAPATEKGLPDNPTPPGSKAPSAELRGDVPTPPESPTPAIAAPAGARRTQPPATSVVEEGVAAPRPRPERTPRRATPRRSSPETPKEPSANAAPKPEPPEAPEAKPAPARTPSDNPLRMDLE